MKIGNDKILHAETSALLVVVGAVILSIIMPKGLAIVLSGFATFAAGFGKEYWDYASGNGKAERGDVRADAIGVAVGVLLCVFM